MRGGSSSTGRLVVRDYSDQRYENKLFTKKQTERAPLALIIFVLTVSFLIPSLVLFIISPWFFVKQVKFEGRNFEPEQLLKESTETFLNQRRYGIIPMRHRLFIQPKTLEAELLSHHPLDAASVKINGDELLITVKEKPTGVMVVGKNTSVFADLNGSIIRLATPEEIEQAKNDSSPLPYLKLVIDASIMTDVGTKLFDSEILQSANSLKNKFEVQTGIETRSFSLPRANANWMTVYLNDGREIYIDLKRDLDPQILKLLVLIKEKGTELKAAKYIDLRYQDRIYYK